ncbi:hypothetical protein HK405_012175 [Cladochytrium tenue]|nr:hypothetical protein HK405_012175 [Cladochytrium tenue]
MQQAAINTSVPVFVINNGAGAQLGSVAADPVNIGLPVQPSALYGNLQMFGPGFGTYGNQLWGVSAQQAAQQPGTVAIQIPGGILLGHLQPATTTASLLGSGVQTVATPTGTVPSVRILSPEVSRLGAETASAQLHLVQQQQQQQQQQQLAFSASADMVSSHFGDSLLAQARTGLAPRRSDSIATSPSTATASPLSGGSAPSMGSERAADVYLPMAFQNTLAPPQHNSGDSTPQQQLSPDSRFIDLLADTHQLHLSDGDPVDYMGGTRGAESFGPFLSLPGFGWPQAHAATRVDGMAVAAASPVVKNEPKAGGAGIDSQMLMQHQQQRQQQQQHRPQQLQQHHRLLQIQPKPAARTSTDSERPKHGRLVLPAFPALGRRRSESSSAAATHAGSNSSGKRPSSSVGTYGDGEAVGDESGGGGSSGTATSVGSGSGNRPRPHRCEVDNCNKSFLRKQDLVRHRATHLPRDLRPFSCPNPGCERRYGRVDAVLRHARLFCTHRHGASADGEGGAEGAPVDISMGSVLARAAAVMGAAGIAAEFGELIGVSLGGGAAAAVVGAAAGESPGGPAAGKGKKGKAAAAKEAATGPVPMAGVEVNTDAAVAAATGSESRSGTVS